MSKTHAVQKSAPTQALSSETPTSAPATGIDVQASPDSAMNMQSTHGNAAVAGMIFRSADGGGSGGGEGDPAGGVPPPPHGGGGAVPFQSQMEASFGEDFSSVQAFTGQAGPMGQLSANAAASGEQVAFASTNPDKGTVAHELTHVVQQRQGGQGVQRSARLSSPGDAAEREADSVASQVVAGNPVSVQAAPAAGIQRDPTGAARTTCSMDGPTQAEIDEAEFFVMGGQQGPITHTPSNGRGGFDATFYPEQSPGLLIEVRAAVIFVNPVTVSGSTVTPTDPDFQGVADYLNGLSPADQAAALPEFMWSTADADRNDWMTRLEGAVESAWSGQHQFHIARSGWDWIGAEVAVDVLTNARTTRDATDHLSIEAVKTPEFDNLYSYGHYSWAGGGATNDAHDQTMRIASTDIEGRPDDWTAPITIYFGSGSSALTPDGESELDSFAATWQGAPGTDGSNAVDINVEGYASSSGSAARNRRLSQQRVETVKNRLRGAGFTQLDSRITEEATGEDHADQTTDNEFDRRVDVSVDNPGGAQVLAVHEFGHTFGLDDQYAETNTDGSATGITGNPVQTGDTTDHDGMVQGMQDSYGNGLPPSIAENNDNVMSGGNEIRPEHYCTFHEALTVVTGIMEWALGPPGPKPTAVDAAGPDATPSP